MGSTESHSVANGGSNRKLYAMKMDLEQINNDLVDARNMKALEQQLQYYKKEAETSWYMDLPAE